jgi:antitoxin component HigA of HigAB toxin-antitoxin module
VPQASTKRGPHKEQVNESFPEAKEIAVPVKTGSRPLPDTYLELIKEFPLVHILDNKTMITAQGMIDRLLAKDLDKGAQQYLDVLTDLVEKYEDEHEPIPDASEGDVLRELMRANNLSQMGLAKKVGISQSTISAVLNGSRSLTKKQVVTLATFFHVAPAAFLPT